MQAPRTVVASAVAAILLRSLPLAAAHGSDEHMDMDMHVGAVMANSTAISNAPPSYFRHPQYAGWMYAHIALMILAWAFILPPAIMLSIARSRYHLPAQVLFHIANGVGIFTGFVYNHATPDLYVNNAHHPIGYVATALTAAWTVLALLNAYSAAHRSQHTDVAATRPRQTMTTANMAQYDQLHNYHDDIRFSRDSAHGSEATLFSPTRSNSSDSVLRKPEAPLPDSDHEEEGHDSDAEAERRGFLGNNRVDRFLSRKIQHLSSARTYTALRFTYVVLEKFLLLLGFAALTSGFVVWGGIFRSREIFSGLAHFVKGGIFFWYGLLTLGRWMGAFSEFGWAWNIRPRSPLVSRFAAWVPSAEFVESFVIWLYGASNVFLEHLNAWGGAWSAQDFEHVSITLLFFGGGLLGMLIESTTMRRLMNTTVDVAKSKEDTVPSDSPRFAIDEPDAHDLWQKPTTYTVPLNPIPALVIMLLGIMMSSHHQASMVSTMMHSQWGTLFVGFALARGVTYITLFLKPPMSHFPSRPPSELIAAFCLSAGGLMFMFSAKDTVASLEANGLDAMIVYTVTMGLTAALMAWELVCFALKGWAVRKERMAAGMPLGM